MNILNIAINLFKLRIRNKLSFILIILMPILMIFIMGYALKPSFEANNTIKKFKVLYVNEDRGAIGKAFDNMLHNQASKYVDLVNTTTTSVQSQIDSGKYDEAIVISKNLSASVLKGKKCSIKIISSGKDEIKAYVVNSLVNSFVNFTNTQTAILKSYSHNLPQANITEEAQKLTEVQSAYGNAFTIPKLNLMSPIKKLSSYQYFTASMLLFFMMMSGIGIGNNIIKERSDKIYARINSFPVKKSEYLLGQIICNITTSIFQAIAIILFSALLFGVNFGNNYMGIAIALLLIILLSASLGVLFSSIVNSEKALSTVLCLILWFIAFMSGGFTPVPSLEPIGKLTFYSWGFHALASFMTGGTFKTVKFELTSLVVLIIVLWTATLALFNWRSQNE